MHLNDWLEAKKIGDQEFGDQIGVTRSYVSRLRRNLVNPSLGVGLRVYKATKKKVDLESLLPRTERFNG